MKNIIYYIIILRPLNFIIAFLTIYVSVIIADKSLAFSIKAIFGSLAGSLIGGAGMVINDYFDFEVDKINRPDRPIPSGKISLKSALSYYSILNFIALILVAFTNIYAFLIAFISIIVIFIYSYKLKSKGLIGNFIVGFMTGLAFIFGGAIGENVVPLMLPFVMGMLINFAREVLKDVEDIEGDRTKNLKTFPIVYGEDKAIKIFVILIGITILSTFVPYFLKIYNVYYLLIILFMVDLPLVYTIKSVLKKTTKAELRKINYLIKYEMIFGLIAIYVGVN
jgi:geranylgeranylglycerol-phosphate geranylgeranyltransferase